MTLKTHRGDGFTLKLERKPGYLHAHVSEGVDSLALSIAYWTHLWQECERFGARKLLVVEDLAPCEMNDAEIHALNSALVELGYCRVKVAFVPLQTSAQLNEHSVIIGVELGLDAMIFSDESFAERWLRYAD